MPQAPPHAMSCLGLGLEGGYAHLHRHLHREPRPPLRRRCCCSSTLRPPPPFRPPRSFGHPCSPPSCAVLLPAALLSCCAQVVVEQVGSPDSTYEEFVGALPETACRYAGRGGWGGRWACVCVSVVVGGEGGWSAAGWGRAGGGRGEAGMGQGLRWAGSSGREGLGMN